MPHGESASLYNALSELAAIKLAWLDAFGRKSSVMIETRGTIHEVILNR